MKRHTGYGWLELIEGILLIILGALAIASPGGDSALDYDLLWCDGNRDRNYRYYLLCQVGTLHWVCTVRVSGCRGDQRDHRSGADGISAHRRTGCNIAASCYGLSHTAYRSCVILDLFRSLYRGRYFYVSLVINVIGLVVGVLMIFWPQIALFSVGFLIGTYLIILGVDSVVSACSKLGKDW